MPPEAKEKYIRLGQLNRKNNRLANEYELYLKRGQTEYWHEQVEYVRKELEEVTASLTSEELSKFTKYHNIF
jgi:hypothetical protein